MSPAQTGLRSPVVCGSLTLSSRFLTLLAYLATPTHPGCSLTFAPNPTHPGCPHSPPPTVLTSLILGPAPKLPGCKRLHLTFSPSWAIKSAGQAKTQIVTHLSSLPPLTTLPYLTTSHQSGCKRLHLTCGPSWEVKSAGRAKTQILSTTSR